MKDKQNLFNLIGGGIIIAAAFAIMLPGVITYLFGIGRILLLVTMTLALAIAFAFVYAKLRKRLTPNGQTQSATSAGAYAEGGPAGEQAGGNGHNGGGSGHSEVV